MWILRMRMVLEFFWRKKVFNFGPKNRDFFVKIFGEKKAFELWSKMFSVLVKKFWSLIKEQFWNSTASSVLGFPKISPQIRSDLPPNMLRIAPSCTFKNKTKRATKMTTQVMAEANFGRRPRWEIPVVLAQRSSNALPLAQYRYCICISFVLYMFYISVVFVLFLFCIVLVLYL